MSKPVMVVLGVLILWYSYNWCTTISIRNLILHCVHVTVSRLCHTFVDTILSIHCILCHVTGADKSTASHYICHTKLWLCQRHCLSISQVYLYDVLFMR